LSSLRVEEQQEGEDLLAKLAKPVYITHSTSCAAAEQNNYLTRAHAGPRSANDDGASRWRTETIPGPCRIALIIATSRTNPHNHALLLWASLSHRISALPRWRESKWTGFSIVLLLLGDIEEVWKSLCRAGNGHVPLGSAFVKTCP
jgi:hypothetical protein